MELEEPESTVDSVIREFEASGELTEVGLPSITPALFVETETESPTESKNQAKNEAPGEQVRRFRSRVIGYKT